MVTAYSLGEMIGGLLIPIVINILVALKCIDWAKKIKSNKIIAFLIGFFLGLLGLLIYWIYYRSKTK